MSAWVSSERFWIDAMNVGVGLLVLVPVALVAGAIFRSLLHRRGPNPVA